MTRPTLASRSLPRQLSISAVVLVVVAMVASAQYAINSHTVSGGGGTSTNGQYTVSGTVGQLDAGGVPTNGPYSVTGGFWALPQVVQTEGAPTLTIAPGAPGFAIISWSPATPGFVLQETWGLSLPNWTNSASGQLNPVSVSTTNSARSFRLKKQ